MEVLRVKPPLYRVEYWERGELKTQDFESERGVLWFCYKNAMDVETVYKDGREMSLKDFIFYVLNLGKL